MNQSIEDQTLALASLFQCAQLIHQISTTGTLNQPAFESSMETLFRFNTENTLQVFGDLSALITGFKSILYFDKRLDKQPEKLVLYYVLSMLKLAAKVQKQEDTLNRIQLGLEKIEQQNEQFNLGIKTVSQKIDLLYQDTLSEIKPRIMIQGDQRHLSSSDHLSKVRTLLFSGIRAAFLWHQLGGSKWKLLFSKKRYLQQSEDFLRQVQL